MGERGGCCRPMDLFLSEPMQLVQLIIVESAHRTIGSLGDVGLIQFKDLNSMLAWIYNEFFSVPLELFGIQPMPAVIFLAGMLLLWT
ncbi:hypothetical protein F0562_028538 [Nyssa sinensis]|uniref:Uncharacterized protein n=1 Tax=Nyssa sinensis TaxID=561372 RepID=A0A5J5B0H4_9ASTE|nr:hypothetical protein F0562_028538 [Nyssa sinensis]